MSLTNELQDIANDLNNGSSRLLALIDPILSKQELNQYRQIFAFLYDSRLNQAITSDTVNKCINFIKTLDSDNEKVEYYSPLMNYLTRIPPLYEGLAKEREDYVALCNAVQAYSYLGDYYSKEPFDFDATMDNDKKLERAVTTGIVYIKAHMKEQARKMSQRAVFRTKGSNPRLAKPYYLFRASYGLMDNNFIAVSDNYYKLFTWNKEDPEAKEYLNLAASYAILSDNAVKRNKIRVILQEDLIQQSKLYGLLESMVAGTFVTPEKVKTYVEVLQNLQGFTESLFNTIILNQNLFSISKLFLSISFDRISQITGSTTEEMLKNITKLIETKQINALIDQPRKMILFSPIDEQVRKDESISQYCQEMQLFAASLPK